MKQKDYAAIAAEAKRRFHVNSDWTDDQYWRIRFFFGKLGDVFTAADPAFDIKKFWQDCGF